MRQPGRERDDQIQFAISGQVFKVSGDQLDGSTFTQYGLSTPSPHN